MENEDLELIRALHPFTEMNDGEFKDVMSKASLSARAKGKMVSVQTKTPGFTG